MRSRSKPEPRRVGAGIHAAILLTLVGSVACSDNPVAVAGADTDINLAVSSAPGFFQLCNAELPVTVTATLPNGRPAANVLLNFVVTSGGGRMFGGAAITSKTGTAQDYWMLGAAPDAINTIEVRGVDASGAKVIHGALRYGTHSRIAAVHGYLPFAIFITGQNGQETDWRFETNDPEATVDWSPAGDRDLLVHTAVDETGRHIYVTPTWGLEPLKLTHTGVNRDPAWSPDGTRIAFSRDVGDGNGAGIYVMDADGSNVRQLTSPFSDLEADIEPTWSPDGRRLAWSRVQVADSDASAQIWITDAESYHWRRVPGSSGDRTPRWSPDGSRIAVTNYREANGLRIHRVLLTSPEGTFRRDVAPGRNPAWSPDGGKLVFTHEGSMHVATPDGLSVVRPLNVPEARSFAWSPCVTRP